MKKSTNAIFTICAKNYLAQALTLMDSVKNHNCDIDFYIYLADEKEDVSIAEIVTLDDSWISKWKEMAFKYDVVEFSTAIKPFCIHDLFVKCYDKVIYLDPDVYVTNSLSCIWRSLDAKSIVLSPHFFSIENLFSGAVSDSAILRQGVFNLGFIAVRNNDIGNIMIDWWMTRLQDECFVDAPKGTFVDQKWMNFAPVFFPNDVEISHNVGINVAIWNLHERTLLIHDDQYMIKDNATESLQHLVFFHFSGFDPFDKSVINRRHPQYNVGTYPTFAPIINEYRDEICRHSYDYYSKLNYNFATFRNGEMILPIHRRWYSIYAKRWGDISDPFDNHDAFYQLLSKKKCLTHVKSSRMRATNETKNKASSIENYLLKPLLRVLSRVLGIRWYFYMLRFAAKVSRLEYSYFLIDGSKYDT